MNCQCSAQCKSTQSRCKNMAKFFEDDKSLCTKHYRQYKSHEACCICMDDMTSSTSMKLDCGHYFHTSCLQNWATQQESCPMCRTSFSLTNLKTIHSLYINNLTHILFSFPYVKRIEVATNIQNYLCQMYSTYGAPLP